MDIENMVYYVNQSRTERVEAWRRFRREKEAWCHLVPKLLLAEAPARGKANNIVADLCVEGNLDLESGIDITGDNTAALCFADVFLTPRYWLVCDLILLRRPGNIVYRRTIYLTSSLTFYSISSCLYYKDELDRD